MNIDIIEAYNRIRIPRNEIGNNRISAIYKHKDEHDPNNIQQPLFIGLTNGDLLIYHLTENPTSSEGAQIPSTTSKTTSSAISIRSNLSARDIKRLFQDRENQSYKIANVFRNITKDGSSILKIESLPISSTKLIILVSTSSALGVFEIVGTHINQIYSIKDCKNAVSLYLVHDDRKLLIVGNKKKLTVYHITNKSRNIFQFNTINEITMKDRIRTIDKFTEETLLIGLINDYVICKYSDFSISSLTLDYEMEVFNRTSSFSYFGLSSSGPMMWTLPINSDEFLLVKDTQVIKINKSQESTTLSPPLLKLSAIPISVLFIYPIYLLVVYPKKIEILDFKSGDLIQKFHHHIGTNQLSLSVDDSLISLAYGSDVLEFKVLPFELQIEQYLTIAGKPSIGHESDPRNDLKFIGIEKAILLVSNIDHSDQLFNGEKDKFMRLRKLYTSKAVLLFDSYGKYHESLVDISSEWLVSFRDVLNLFPDFLNGELRAKPVGANDDENTKEHKNSKPNHSSFIKRVTIEDVELINNSESESESDNASRKVPASKQPQQTLSGGTAKNHMMRRFFKAVNNLIVYLTDQRRILSTFMDKSVLPWKDIEVYPSDIYPDFSNKLEKVAGIIDTTLFLCYFFCKPMLLGPLLRLPNNLCDSKIVNECLLSNIHNHTQQRSMKQPNFIKELLDFYYCRGLHEEALEMLYKLAHDEEEVEHSNEEDNYVDDFLRGPTLTIQYMSKLTNGNLDLVFKYSDWVIDLNRKNVRFIFMNDSYECESYDNAKVLRYLSKKDPDLGIEYLEWLLFVSDITESLKKSRLYSQFETKLCLLYLKQLNNGKHESNYYYEKLENILKSSQTFEPWPILKEIPTTNDKFLRLTVYIYKKLEEHEKSIDVLFNQLNDLDSAMEYCLEIYNRPNGASKGSSLFYKLLEDLLMNYNENLDFIERLLSIHGTKIPVLKVLSVLPNSFPISKLKQYFYAEISQTTEKVKDTHIISKLYKTGSANVEQQVKELEKESYKISSSKDECIICHKKLGY
ncbi:hypothetical protein G210_5886, partial [Candida maltosa Xu316]